MLYKTVQVIHMVQKVVHTIFQLGAFLLGVVGLCAVFKFHDMSNVEDVYSLHSWIGITTISLFAVQWLAGFIPASVAHLRQPLLYMSIVAALTGLMEKATFQQLQSDREARLVNILGLCILLFGIFVDLCCSCTL